MLGTTDSATATAEVSTARKRDEDRNSFTERLSDNESKPSGRSTDWDNSLPSNLDIAESARALCLQSVEYYFAAFAIGYLEEESASSPPEFAVQRAFIRWANIMDASHDSTGTSRTVERWRSLSKCFAVLKFHQQAIESVELDSLSKACTIQSTARYILRITPNTIQSSQVTRTSIVLAAESAFGPSCWVSSTDRCRCCTTVAPSAQSAEPPRRRVHPDDG